MKAAKPLVSVVMSTHNGEKYVEEQIESILQQSYDNIELIITDDRSTDRTRELLRRYAESFANITLFFNEANVGYIKTFEKGMLRARGDFVALSDQDDIWLHNKIEALVNQIENFDIVYCDSELVDEDGKPLNKKMSDVINQLTYTDCLKMAVGAWIPGHAQLIRRSLIEKCVPFPTTVAHDFWLGFVASCNKGAGYFNHPLVLYRQHGSNLVGANTLRKKRSRRKTVAEKNMHLRERMHLLYTRCPADLPQKKIFTDLNKSYQSFSLANNWLRAKTFFRYRDRILAYKRKSGFGKVLFCIKMFFKLY